MARTPQGVIPWPGAYSRRRRGCPGFPDYSLGKLTHRNLRSASISSAPRETFRFLEIRMLQFQESVPAEPCAMACGSAGIAATPYPQMSVHETQVHYEPSLRSPEKSGQGMIKSDATRIPNKCTMI